MQNRISPPHLFIFLFMLGVLLATVQFGLVTIAFDKLGLSQESAFLLLISSLLGSSINLPLFSVRSSATPDQLTPELRGLLRLSHLSFSGRTVIAVNVGGCLIPLGFSLFLIGNHSIDPLSIIVSVTIVTLICFAISRPISGIGIGMPILIAPFSAALLALLLAPDHSAPLAYIAGTSGVIIGADLLHLKDIRQIPTPVASIGGAGTFDGIFITGLIAVLLA